MLGLYNSSQVSVQVGEVGEVGEFEDDVGEVGWCMVVFQGKPNKVVVYTAISIGNIQPADDVLGPCLL